MLLALTDHPKRVLFVGGKGGVGKTSVSSALAYAHATANKRVLLVSTDPAHNLGHLWGMQLSDAPTRLVTIGEGFVDGVEIDPDATLERHLDRVRDLMRWLLPERMQPHAARHLELAREAPGSHEAAVLERVADLVNLGLESYDLVLFDTAPTGHTLRLLSLPGQLGGWTESLLANRDRSDRFASALRGLATGDDEGDAQQQAEARLRRTIIKRRERFALLQETLHDPERTGFIIVLTPERIPVAETIELTDALQNIGVKVTAHVANRCSPVDAGEFLAQRARTEEEHLGTLTEQTRGIPLTRLPLLIEEPLGVDGLARIASHLHGDAQVGS